MNDIFIPPEPSAPSNQTVTPQSQVSYPQPAVASAPGATPPPSHKKKLLISLILIIVLLLGFVGWVVSHPKSNISNNINKTNSAACSTTVQTANNNSQLPSGWNWYEIKDIGLKYAYPKGWDSPTTQTNSGSKKYVASFTVGSSGANTMVSLSPDCSDFQSNLADINNGKFDTLSGPAITKAIKHDQSSYSSLSHWSSDAGNQYKLVAYDLVSVGNIRSVEVDYSIISGSEVCPDDKLASNNQPKCLNQSVSDEVGEVISSLQKI